MKRVLIVSPHRDDAAFSCGIAIRSLVRQARITVANLFTVSRYAPFGGVRAESVSGLRQEEDLRFAELCGADLQDLHLIDAPERLSIPVSEISTCREFDERDREPIKSIRNHIAAIGADCVLAPLALGDHIDHRIAQYAAVTSDARRLAFYEDLPYAARIPKTATKEQAASLELSLAPLIIRSNDGADWKKKCVNCYPSQVGSETAIEIAEYSGNYGKGERLWVAPNALEWLSQIAG